MTTLSQPPSVGKGAKNNNASRDTLPELELIKIIGFVMVVACHFWVIHALPRIFGLDSPPPGLGIDASTPSRIDLAAWFPAFPEHSGIYTVFNLVFGFGYQGVGVFFILTGFGLTLSALRKPRLDPWGYALARFERIYLPYLGLLAVVTAFTLLTTGRHHVDLRALVLMDTGIPYAWFLFPLLQFYVLFPFLFLLVHGRRVSATGLLTGAIAVNFAWAFAVLFAAYNFRPDLAEVGACAPKGLLPFRIAEPVFGMWLGFLYHQNRERFTEWLHPRRLGVFAATYVCGCCLSLAETTVNVGGWRVPLGQSVSNLLTAVGLFGLLFLLARAMRSAATRLLPLARYGFEFYLLQSIPLAGLAWVLPRIDSEPLGLLGLLSLVLAVNLALAALVHHGIQATLVRAYLGAKNGFAGLNSGARAPVSTSPSTAVTATASAPASAALAPASVADEAAPSPAVPLAAPVAPATPAPPVALPSPGAAASALISLTATATKPPFA